MPDTSAHSKAQLLFDPWELAYDLGKEHPFQSRRLVALIDLLKNSGLWHKGNEQNPLPFRAATTEELALIHTPDYIAAVQQLSTPLPSTASENEREEREQLATTYGFNAGDTPAVPGLHEAAAQIVGGTLISLRAVMGLPEGGAYRAEQERPVHVFHPAGGLHHAWAERASGFCVYNDAAVAIAHILRASEAKVLYVDFDAHHGDGMQRAFYDDSRVMTVSFHETGHFLFPGTGDVLELGQGIGRGYTVNVPLEPFTEDNSFIEAITALLPPLVLAFAPNVIVSQHGCDSHAWDPLTHLELSLRSMQAQSKLVHQLAHDYCQGRWLALGGGGYDQFRVVPRAWSILWAEMSEQALPEHLPEEWIVRWRPEWQAVAEQEEAGQQALGKAVTPSSFPTIFEDRPEDFPAQPREWSISRTNQRTVALVRQLLLPPPVRQAFPHARYPSPMSSMVDLLHVRGNATPSRSKTFETARGPLLLRDFCPLSLVERLKVESGMCAFARVPEREHQILLHIAKSSDCALTLAHTPAGEIVGEVSLVPAEEWFKDLEDAYEVAIEVSAHWRGMGVAQALLAYALAFDTLEDVILFAMGLSWHWDLKGLDVSVYQYRDLIRRLFATQGFVEYATNEPDITMEPGNIFLARFGKRVDQQSINRFMNRLLASPNLLW